MRRLFITVLVFTLLGLGSVQAQGGPPVVQGCTIFPADNLWNTRVDTALVHPNSAAYIANINANGGGRVNLHPDFGADPTLYHESIDRNGQATDMRMVRPDPPLSQ
jgi:hypothetical protein